MGEAAHIQTPQTAPRLAIQCSPVSSGSELGTASKSLPCTWCGALTPSPTAGPRAGSALGKDNRRSYEARRSLEAYTEPWASLHQRTGHQKCHRTICPGHWQPNASQKVPGLRGNQRNKGHHKAVKLRRGRIKDAYFRSFWFSSEFSLKAGSRKTGQVWKVSHNKLQVLE